MDSLTKSQNINVLFIQFVLLPFHLGQFNFSSLLLCFTISAAFVKHLLFLNSGCPMSTWCQWHPERATKSICIARHPTIFSYKGTWADIKAN